MNKIKGRDYGVGKFQKHLYGKPRHFRSDYTQKNSPFKGCFGRCKYLIVRQLPVLKKNNILQLFVDYGLER